MATTILHDSLTGLRTDALPRIDIYREPIAGLYRAGQAGGGFGYYGLLPSARLRTCRRGQRATRKTWR